MSSRTGPRVGIANERYQSARCCRLGLEDGERCLYVTFQENANQPVRKADSFGWDLNPYLKSGQLKFFHVTESSLDLDILPPSCGTRLRAAGCTEW